MRLKETKPEESKEWRKAEKKSSAAASRIKCRGGSNRKGGVRLCEIRHGALLNPPRCPSYLGENCLVKSAAADCHFVKQNGSRVVKINSYGKVPKSDAALLCAATQQPVTVSLDATYLQHYRDGIFDGGDCEKDSTYTNHAVLIVGYGSKDRKDYWIVKNSWGANWGMDGYFLMKRNTDSPNRVCSINTKAYFPSI
ncbi:cysteine proteinase COT44-like [Neltuma alba]|uniref:cysteine proteinase COT44-like n=1 Tax=Neltuma alba TaxID=207710 RepID=UPI0010A41954|nr:cysteine proteinase COT44-like [Prosopis alba]